MTAAPASRAAPASNPSAGATRAAAKPNDDELESSILRRFTERARAEGPRAVVMADLARDLGISTKTLYRIFPSKADLVQRLMEWWASGLERQLERDEESEGADGPFVDELLHTSEVWQANRRRFGPSFWEELERDYPNSFRLVTDARQKLRSEMLERLRPFVRPHLSPTLAMELFDASLVRAMDADVQQRHGIDGATALRNAVSIWAEGALTQPLRSRGRRAAPAATVRASNS